MLLCALLYLLLLIAVTLRRDISILFSRISIIITLYCIIIAISSFYLKYLDNGIALYGGLFHATCNTHIFQIFLFIITTIILQLTAFYPRKVWIKEFSYLHNILIYKYIYSARKIINKMGHQFKIIEYPLIILFILTGAIFLLSTNDLVSLFLSIELQSYGLYLLSTLYRNSELATKAGLTYFLLGGLSSCFILLASSLLYANSGTTNLEAIYVITNLSDSSYINGYVNALYIYKPDYINFSFILLSVGFLFKISAAPFHYWSPDVYDAIPTIVTTFVAILGKISIFIFLLDLVHYTSNSFLVLQYTWINTLLLSSLLSLIVGTILGLTQFRIKRLFAYSTISHIGFILLALSINSIESITAFIFYLMQYSISNLNAFVLLISIGFSLFCYINNIIQYKNLLDKNNSPIQVISQIKGYFSLNPLIAISLALTMFSFIGIPPLIGFFAKQMVLSAALDSGYVFLALMAILTSVISAAYYLGVIKQVFFDKIEYELDSRLKFFYLHVTVNHEEETLKKITFNLENIVLSSYLTITISVFTLIILFFIFTPQESINIANILAIILFNL